MTRKAEGAGRESHGQRQAWICINSSSHTMLLGISLVKAEFSPIARAVSVGVVEGELQLGLAWGAAP